MKLADAKITQVGFKLIQTGEPGAGKTYRACSAAAFGPIKFIDVDNKLIGLKSRLTQDWINVIDIETPTNYMAFNQIIDQLDTYPKQYATLVLDTMSRAYDRTVDYMKALNPKGDGRMIYWNAQQRNQEILNRMLALPMNIIINTHVGLEEMEDGTSKLTSSTAGKFGKMMPQYVNDVHYCYLNTLNKHKVRGEPSHQVVARTVVRKDLLDEQGVFKVEDLSIFNDVAYRIKP